MQNYGKNQKTKKMEEKRKRLYAEPTADVVELDVCRHLLAGSGETENNGYGDPIPEGSEGWH